MTASTSEPRFPAADALRTGLAGPFRLFTTDETARIRRKVWRTIEARGAADDTWARMDLHAEIPEVADLLRAPELGDRLESVMGPDVLLFQTHVGRFDAASPGPLWHRHVYHDWDPQPPTNWVARLALEPEPEHHCHRFVPRWAAPDLTTSFDDLDAPPTVSTPLEAGEFILFDGTMLHAAGDRVDGRPALGRTSLVARFANPAQHLGAFADKGRCVLLRGRDPHQRNAHGRLAAAG